MDPEWKRVLDKVWADPSPAMKEKQERCRMPTVDRDGVLMVQVPPLDSPEFEVMCKEYGKRFADCVDQSIIDAYTLMAPRWRAQSARRWRQKRRARARHRLRMRANRKAARRSRRGR